MSTMSLTAVFALMISVVAVLSAAAHLETVFTVSLPDNVTYGEGLRYEDAVYILAGEGTVVAVNLTTRTMMWVSPNVSEHGQINGFGVTSKALLLSFYILPGETPPIVALSTKTGEVLWGGAVQLSFPVTAFATNDTIYAYVLGNEYPAVQPFDLATGEPGAIQFSDGLWIYGDTAFTIDLKITIPWSSTLRAIDISTSKTLWTTAAPGPVVAANEKYIALLNYSGNSEVPVVLHRENGTVARTLQAFNQSLYGSVIALLGDELFTLVGEEHPRYVLADVATGDITWTRSYFDAGPQAIICNRTLVGVDFSFNALVILPIGSNGPALSVPNVQIESWALPIDFGYGVVQVPNLQGYTLWDVSTGALLGNRTFAKPSYSEPMAWKWEGMSVGFYGNNITAFKLVP